MANKGFDKFLEQQNQGKKPNPITNNKEKGKPTLSEAEKRQRLRKNVKVYDETFFGVIALAQLKGMTQDELVKWLIKNAVNELDESEKEVFQYLKSKAQETAEKRKKN